jgi:hypothetical protein
LMCSISFWLDHLDLHCLIGFFPLNLSFNALLNIFVSFSFLRGEVQEIISAESLLTNFVLQLLQGFLFLILYIFLFPSTLLEDLMSVASMLLLFLLMITIAWYIWSLWQ